MNGLCRNKGATIQKMKQLRSSSSSSSSSSTTKTTRTTIMARRRKIRNVNDITARHNSLLCQWRQFIVLVCSIFLLQCLVPTLLIQKIVVVHAESESESSEYNSNNNNIIDYEYEYEQYEDHFIDDINNKHDYNRQLLALRGVAESAGELIDKEIYHHSSSKNDNGNIIPSSNITIPIHSHSGTHHVYLYIGSPPQRQTLIIDTGSKAMAFPCKTCKNCGQCCGNHASPYFDPSLSTTHFVTKCSGTGISSSSSSCLLEGISGCSLFGDFCTFSQKYTEGSSWVATEVEDMVWFGTSSITNSIELYMPSLAIAYPFGCQTSSKGLFRKQYADGILGLLIHPKTSVISALWREGIIERDAFSLCLTREGGYLTLGGTPSSTSTTNSLSPMKMTPITNQDHGYYSVEVIRILIGDTIIASTTSTTDSDSDTTNTNRNRNRNGIRNHILDDINSGKGCIFDSGTTDTFFPSSLEKIIRKTVMNNTTDNMDYFSNKFRRHMYTFDEFQQLPTITIVFASSNNEASIDIIPQNYMENVPSSKEGKVSPWEDKILLVNRIYFEESDGGTVLGANAMFGYVILFDSEGRQMGISKSITDCYDDNKSVATTVS
jgi:hypothetical protein